MKVQINNYIKRDEYGDFVSGQVFFESLIRNEEVKTLPTTLIVNLSKSGNPQCDTSINFLQSHNAHAGTFTSHAVMKEYVKRVTQDIRNIVDEYNMEQEETAKNPGKLDHAIIETNEDLSLPPAPAYVIPEGIVMFNIENMEQMHDLLMDMIEEDEDDG